MILANWHPGPDALPLVLTRAAQALRPGGHLYVVGHHADNIGRHGSTDPDRLFTVERLGAALPADLSVDVLDTRPRAFSSCRPERPNELVVLAWATKPLPPRCTHR